MSTDIETMQAQLDAARAAEEARVAAEHAAASDRERDYRRQWLADYDRDALRREVVEAERALTEALEATPAFAALANLRAAMHRQYRSSQIAHNHRVWLAVDAGETPPHDPMTAPPPVLTPDTLVTAIDRMVAARVAEWQEREDEAYAAAVYGENLTPEQILEAETQAEAERRRQAARSLDASTPADQLTDEQRAAMGLPSRTAHRERQGR